MNRIKAICIFLMLAAITGCQRQCSSINRKWQTTARHYEVVMYSGGDTVFHDNFHGIINESHESDGCYYYKGDTLVEISGDYIIKSDK
jgi:hypothetical protein